MFLCKEMTSHSLSEIGSFFGGKDHSTVVYGLKRVQSGLESTRSCGARSTPCAGSSRSLRAVNRRVEVQWNFPGNFTPSSHPRRHPRVSPGSSPEYQPPFLKRFSGCSRGLNDGYFV